MTRTPEVTDEEMAEAYACMEHDRQTHEEKPDAWYRTRRAYLAGVSRGRERGEAEIARLRKEIDDNAEAYVEYFAKLIESLPPSAKRKAEMAIMLRARQIRKAARSALEPL